MSEAIVALEDRYPDALTRTDRGPVILSSDYSGQHQGATHESYSFLVTCADDFNPWLDALRSFREEWLPDGRTLSFKKMNEAVRRRAIPTYLETIGQLRGNLVTVMVAGSIGSFFGGTADELRREFADCFTATTRPRTMEKMFRHATIVAMLTAGLRREDQEMYWVSDHDETLETNERREGFARLASYLSFGLTQWRNPASTWFATTELCTAPAWAEDVTAVTDIAAGSYCKLTEQLPSFFGYETWVTQVSPSNADARAQAFGNWLTTGSSALRNVLVRLELDEAGEVRASAQSIVGAVTRT